MNAPTALRALVMTIATIAWSSTTYASLDVSYQFNGKGNWSLDAVGFNSASGSLDAVVPLGSTIEKAFLYSTQTPLQGTFVPNITLQGQSYTGAAWTFLGSSAGGHAYRADVTAQISALVGGGAAVPFSFSVEENANNGATDGEVLAIVYRNASESDRTIAFKDGFLLTGGDSTTISFASPLTEVGNPGFEAILSLGMGYGFQGSTQFSLIDGSGRRLTSSAGGQDDGAGENGALITVGGLGDLSSNPDPFAVPTGPRTDDELYDLGQGNSVDGAPFLANGMTSYTLRSVNPSNDDHVFFMGLNLTAQAEIHGVPETASTATLLGIALAGLVFVRRRIR